MQIHDVIQGSPEWDALRAKHNTASEAPAMMGASKKVKRNELLNMKATGGEREFSEWFRANILDKGHEVEAMARPIAEEIIGDELYPVTATETLGGIGLLASFDGITMTEDMIWECKQWNEAKAASVRAGEVPLEDRWQVVQQLAISRAAKCLYMVTDGTADGSVWCWATLDPADESLLIASWKQFANDLADYKPVEVIQSAAATPISDLPAISYRLDGLSLRSNLTEYREAAEKLVEDSKKALETDQDFADREALNKKFGEAEGKLELVRSQVIGEIKDVDQFCRDLDDIRELIRQARLNGEKQVKTRKDAIRIDIQQKGVAAMAEHIATLNKRIGHNYMPRIETDFQGVMKGKRTLASLQDAVDTELARAKIEASGIADRIQINLQAHDELAQGINVCPDIAQLVLKPADDFANVVKLRISEHHAAMEAERERIRLEEQAKSKEAADKAEAERLATEQNARSHEAFERQASANNQTQFEPAPSIERVSHYPAPAEETAATLKLGEICNRLGFMVTADFLATLGFQPAKIDKTAKLYSAANFKAICHALINHLEAVANDEPMKKAA
jgi:predicted phage-related endonuclease